MAYVFYGVGLATALYGYQLQSQSLFVMSLIGGALIMVAGRCYQVAARSPVFIAAPSDVVASEPPLRPPSRSSVDVRVVRRPALGTRRGAVGER
jgi:hypothetical protein